MGTGDAAGPVASSAGPQPASQAPTWPAPTPREVLTRLARRDPVTAKMLEAAVEFSLEDGWVAVVDLLRKVRNEG